MNLPERSPERAMIHHFHLVVIPKVIPNSVQRWESGGYSFCRDTTPEGQPREWIRKPTSNKWIETTDWQTPTIKEKP